MELIDLQGDIFKIDLKLENALTLFLIPFLFYNFVRYLKVINIEKDLGVGITEILFRYF